MKTQFMIETYVKTFQTCFIIIEVVPKTEEKSGGAQDRTASHKCAGLQGMVVT